MKPNIVTGAILLVWALIMVVLHYSSGYIPSWWVASMWCAIAGIANLTPRD